MRRYLETDILDDLKKKMVFLGGPRQVGKTTLAHQLLEVGGAGSYFNWDHDEDRQGILKKRWRTEDTLLVFDELHKFPHWKSWVKGIHDVEGKNHRILVTGSARLDVYRQGGDSLMGRYHHWRLHPLSLDELPPGIGAPEALSRLLSVGGFPEPFLSNDTRECRRWRKERFDRVLQEDIRDLENIRNIQQLRLLLDLLRDRVGGLVVVSNLARDVMVAPQTAKAWIEALERMYVLFRVTPYTRDIARAVQKPPKVYFLDVADAREDPGSRLENLVGAGLLKRLHYLEDREGHRCELHYVRDKEGREVDFATVIDGVLDELVEVKSGDDSISPALAYYTRKLKPRRATQIVGSLWRPYDQEGIRVTDPVGYFSRDIPWHR